MRARFTSSAAFFAAILADQGGDGYVRHIGRDRRVSRDYLNTLSPANSQTVETEAGSRQSEERRSCAQVPEQHNIINNKSVSAMRDHYARILMVQLAAQPGFDCVTLNCGQEREPGVDEGPEWRIWTERDTTADQLRIEEELQHLVKASSSILHIGAGNSRLGQRFAPHVSRILGTTIHDEERIFAEKLGLENYIVVTANKFSDDMDNIDGHFDFIVDNNPSTFCCCLFHFSRMMVSYLGLLRRDGGLLLTDQSGLSWVCTGSNLNISLRWDDWERLGNALGMPVNEFRLCLLDATLTRKRNRM